MSSQGLRIGDIERAILKLANAKDQFKFAEVATAIGKSEITETERKAITRTLTAMVKKGHLLARGTTKARIYSKHDRDSDSEKMDRLLSGTFAGVPISRQSQQLLDFLSLPLEQRVPISYQLEFLQDYEPNKTFYLNSHQRMELKKMGKVETTSQPAGTYARRIMDRLVIDLSWNSSRLEGNTYSLLETQRLLQLGEAVAGKAAEETQMILNHKAAIEFIVELATENDITEQMICNIHALLSENLLGDSAACGRLRLIPVSIGGSTFLPLNNPHVLKQCFTLVIEKLNAIADPFEQSFFSLIHLPYLQAFEDVNKRTARLVANIPLIRNNLKPLSFTDIDSEVFSRSLLGVYERTNISLALDMFMRAYERSTLKYAAVQNSLGEPNLFKLKYRNIIHQIIRDVIINKRTGAELPQYLRDQVNVSDMEASDKAAVVIIIEQEILGLHEGNFARYKVRPSQFHDWFKQQKE